MQFYCSHIYREGNGVTDTLANIGLGFSDFTWWNFPALEFKKFMLDNSWGIPKHQFS